MSLQTRLAAFIAEVGADMKAVRTQPDRLAEELSQGVIWIGHRGGPLVYPENGMRGLRACAEAGFMVETDVRATSDNQLIIMHDATFDRTTNLTGNVASTTYANARKGLIDPPNPGLPAEPIPTWLEVLEMAHETSAIFIPETKDGLLVTRNTMIADMKARRMEKQAVPCSFDLNDVVAFAAAGFQASYVTGDNTTNWQSVWNQGVRWCSINIANFTLAQVNAIKAIGFKVLAWTTDTWTQGQAAIAKGVHGVITDDPWLGSDRRNPNSWMKQDGSLPANFTQRHTGTDIQTTKDLSADGWRWAGPGILQRRGVSGDNSVRGLDLGFGERVPTVIRGQIRVLPGATDQTMWCGFAVGKTADPDTVFDDNFATTGQTGYTFVLRRNGAIDCYVKSASGSTSMGSVLDPTPDITTVVTGTSAWQDIEIRFTATQIIVENKTTGLSATFTESTWRGASRLYLMSRGTDFELNTDSIVFA